MNEQEGLDVKLARLEVKIDGLVERVDERGKTEMQLRLEIDKVREQARHDCSVVRVDLERQLHVLQMDLEKHEQAVNPHPQQEDWLRRHVDRLTVSIDGLRTDLSALREKGTVDLLQALMPITTDINQAKGAGRIVWPAVAAFVAAVAAFVAGRLLGG